MTAKGWCLPCCTNTNSLINACILCSYTMRGCLLCAQRKLLKVCSIHTGGHQIIPLLKEESMTFSDQKTSPWCSQTGHALLSDLHFFVSVLQLFFFLCFFLTQRSDLACSVRLVSPSGDVGLNSRVWSDYVSAVWEIPLGPVGSLHILCWQ